MAVNVLATTFLGLEFLLFLISFSSASPKNLQYHVINSNKLTPEGSFVVKLDSHSRLRRQVDSSSSSSPGLTPDHSSQAQPAVTPGPSTNAPGEGAGSKPNSTVAPTTSSFQTSNGAANANESSNSSTGTGSSTVASTTIADPFADSDVIHDFHEYYTTDVLKSKGSEYWQELKDVPRHETLSTGHRVAAVIPLKFPFHFYGHEVTNVTVATGGFIYMSPFLHQWLTATQYIAPLMANFDPSLSKDSGVYYKNDEDKFTVEWKNVMLKDQNSSGNFSFQAILHKDDVIHFVYNSVPISVRGISTDEHPVKIGLSDAYYNDTYIPEYKIKRRTIYEYHKVSVKVDTVKSGTVIVFKPLPTCNRLSDCNTCIKHVDVAFDCRWCNTIGRCSDGLDWYRQHWDKEGCQLSHTNASEICSSLPPPTKPITDPLNPSSQDISPQNPSTQKIRPQNSSSQSPSSQNPVSQSPNSKNLSSQNDCNHTKDSSDCASLPPPRKPIKDPLKGVETKNPCENGKCNKKSEFPVAVVVVVVLIVCGLLGSVGGWLYYAYTHPTSKSGMWLMEHRPSQIKANIKFWKNNSDAGTKYKVESET
ncbi:unnamed protein product [Lymnaea stagnalis]|uniref:Plexin domain-containing protein 2 n=1 Tax=Lymnaea stagnalis TaxID=6523 RepID=A0AAV2HIE9_LYMST